MKCLLATLFVVVLTTGIFAADKNTQIVVQSEQHTSMNFTITLKTFQRMFRFLPAAVRDRAKTEYRWFREQNLGDADLKRGSMDCTIRMASEGSMTFTYRGITGTIAPVEWSQLDPIFDYKPKE